MDSRLRRVRGHRGEPVTPPEFDVPPGFDPAAVPARLRAWAGSDAMRDLVEAFGGTLPADADAGALLAWLDGFSDVHWNFRGRLGGVERDRVRVDVPAHLAAAAHAAGARLGLDHAIAPRHPEYTFMVILGGLAGSCLERTAHAARLAGTLRFGAIAALGSLRPLGPAERARPGLGECRTEADALAAGVRTAFGGRAVDVLTAPPREPGAPRANTADTYAFWAARARPRPEDRILVVTSPVYVPFQHFDAVRILGLRYRCGIETVGFEPEVAPGADRVLQETRSAIRAARALHAAVTG